MLKSNHSNTPSIKLKRLRRNQKSKKTDLLIEYGNPDTKVVVRLLPPSLNETDFREQAMEKSLTFRSGFEGLSFEMGRKATKLYEEPKLSIAFVKFETLSSADNFKREVSQVLFKELTTDDKIKCCAMRSIFGELAEVETRDDAENIENEVFKLFGSLRDQNDGHIDINEVLAAFKSSTKRKKKNRAKTGKPHSQNSKTRTIVHAKGNKNASHRELHKHAMDSSDSKEINSGSVSRINLKETKSKPKKKQKQKNPPESSVSFDKSSELKSASSLPITSSSSKKKKKKKTNSTPDKL